MPTTPHQKLGTIARTERPVVHALNAIMHGAPVVLIDNTHHQGVLVFAAESATVTLVSFAIKHTSGFLRVALLPADCGRLDLPPMDFRDVRHRVSVDSIDTTTGISGFDRDTTIKALAEPATAPCDLTRPGHVVPIATHSNGVLGAAAVPEAAVDLVRLAGTPPACAFSELVSTLHPTEIATPSEAANFANSHGLRTVSTNDVISYRRRREAASAQAGGSSHPADRKRPSRRCSSGRFSPTDPPFDHGVDGTDGEQQEQ